jgi:hypothetical protein
MPSAGEIDIGGLFVTGVSSDGATARLVSERFALTGT